MTQQPEEDSQQLFDPNPSVSIYFVMTCQLSPKVGNLCHVCIALCFNLSQCLCFRCPQYVQVTVPSWGYGLHLPARLLLEQALKGVLRVRQIARGVEHIHRIMSIHASLVRAGRLSMRCCQGIRSL